MRNLCYYYKLLQYIEQLLYEIIILAEQLNWKECKLRSKKMFI